ncbi:MAG: LLM class flavin-dependent oxidoreductase [Acidimicrobiales bacterium]|jgi:alkanesulfonate monooxygenase SsuD/methylene tetrahydromethanopterin reductase-like flavin-dependent oxidoreductase (luciferase family)|nr:LLM class flavin-dependent oxidoreductase [Acidimicrobiales bacterium]
MEIGMTIPSMLAGLDRRTVLDWARGIDAGPYSTLAVGERIAYPNIEMFTTLAASAAVTDRVRIMSTVVVLPAHAALKVAKMAATIDVLSGGRFVLGVGVGGRDEDYRALERPFARRHQTLDDQVALLRRAWAGEEPGPDLHPVGPSPVQPGGPPIYAGAMGPRAIARAARWATGISGFLLDPLGEDVAGTIRMIDAAWADAGRADRPRHVTSFWYSLDPDGAEVLRAYAARYLGIFGPELADAMAASCSAWSAERVREALVRLADAGFDEVLLVPTTADPAELDRVASLVGDLAG